MIVRSNHLESCNGGYWLYRNSTFRLSKKLCGYPPLSLCSIIVSSVLVHVARPSGAAFHPVHPGAKTVFFQTGNDNPLYTVANLDGKTGHSETPMV